MRWYTEAIGIVLCVQGVGGALSAVLGGEPSWFLVRHVVPDGAQVPVGVVLVLVGAIVLGARTRRKA